MRAVSVKPKKSFEQYVVVDGVKGCRNIEEAQTRDVLMGDDRNKFIVH